MRVAVVAVEIVALEEGPRPGRRRRRVRLAAAAAASVAGAYDERGGDRRPHGWSRRLVLVPVAARSAPAAAQAGKANPMDPDASPARRPGTGSGGGREGHPVPGVPGLAPRVGGRGRRGRLRRRTAVHIGGVPGAFLPISLPVHARAGSVEAEAGCQERAPRTDPDWLSCCTGHAKVEEQEMFSEEEARGRLLMRRGTGAGGRRYQVQGVQMLFPTLPTSAIHVSAVECSATRSKMACAAHCLVGRWQFGVAIGEYTTTTFTT